MKQFLKYVLATVVGMIIVGVVMTIFSILGIATMAASSSATSIDDNSVLVIKLDGAIDDHAQSNPFSKFFGQESAAGLSDILVAVANAKDNDEVKGIYLEAGDMATTPAAMQEMRKALTDFKKSGKFILAYGDNYSQGAYYVASVADSLVINPQGIIDWKGMGMTTTYYKSALDKLGVKMQVFKVGTYKSAVEPYILDEMSDADREQRQTMVDEMWSNITKEVAASRKLTTDSLNSMANNGIFMAEATQYKKVGLVDKVAYSDEVPYMIARMAKLEDKDDYNTVSATQLADVAHNEAMGLSGDIVAVYYAEGSIVDDDEPQGMMDGSVINAKKVCKDLQKLADDDDVKAVVLRVNSPGGSAYASEQIWHAVMNIKAKKPIVVSMGGYAASGGYYISCAANTIVAEPNTLTGSIGIFGVIPEASELLTQKLGIHSSTVKTNEYGDFGGNQMRPFNEKESAIMQAHINRGYETFTKRCADGRKMKQDDIKKIAEGRVWTGEHAKAIGLVDQLGGIDVAIAEAKKLAKLQECSIQSYPDAPNFMDQFMSEVSNDSYADAKLREVFGEYYTMFASIRNVMSRPTVLAEMPYWVKFNM